MSADAPAVDLRESAMSRLVVLWRRPRRATPWQLRLAAYAGGLLLSVPAAVLLGFGRIASLALPVALSIAAELWWQPTRAARQPPPPGPASRAPDAPADPFKDPAHYRGRFFPQQEEPPLALVWFLLPLVLSQVALAIYDASGGSSAVLIGYAAVLAAMVLVAVRVRRLRRERDGLSGGSGSDG